MLYTCLFVCSFRSLAFLSRRFHLLRCINHSHEAYIKRTILQDVEGLQSAVVRVYFSGGSDLFTAMRFPFLCASRALWAVKTAWNSKFRTDCNIVVGTCMTATVVSALQWLTASARASVQVMWNVVGKEVNVCVRALLEQWFFFRSSCAVFSRNTSISLYTCARQASVH